jgi:hypothetical protein
MVSVLVITGPVGVGKSVVLREVDRYFCRLQ